MKKVMIEKTVAIVCTLSALLLIGCSKNPTAEEERDKDKSEITAYIESNYNWSTSYGSSAVISIDEITFTSDDAATAVVTLYTCGTFHDPWTGRSYTTCSTKQVTMNFQKVDGSWKKV